MTLELWDICASRHRGNAQSVAANAVAEPHKDTQRAKVQEIIESAGGAGVTLEEVADAMGVAVNRISGRLTELKKLRLIKQSGTRPTRTGSPAAVYVAA